MFYQMLMLFKLVQHQLSDVGFYWQYCHSLVIKVKLNFLSCFLYIYKFFKASFYFRFNQGHLTAGTRIPHV